MTLTELLQRPASRWAVWPAVALALVAAFSAGRFTAPEQVRERIEFSSLQVEDITRGYKWGKAAARTVRRNVVTEITDAGTVITDRTIEHESAETSSESTEQIARTESTAETSEKTTTLRPDWRIGAQVGASLRPPALVITGPLVLGVTVERRILGGVSAGLWANTVGAGGASVSVEF